MRYRIAIARDAGRDMNVESQSPRRPRHRQAMKDKSLILGGDVEKCRLVTCPGFFGPSFVRK